MRVSGERKRGGGSALLDTLRSGIGGDVRRVLVLTVLLCACAPLGWCGTEWILGLVLLASLGVFGLVLAGVASLALAPSAPEEGEPRVAAVGWSAFSAVWAGGLGFESLCPGRLESGDGGMVFALALALVSLAWAYVIARTALARRRPRPTRAAFHPRAAADAWFAAATLFCAFGAVVSSRTLFAQPGQLVWVWLQSAPWFVGLFFASRFLLRELPAGLDPAPLPARRRAALWLLRASSVLLAVSLCATALGLDGIPPAHVLVLAGLALLGGLHLALELLIRELPRAARTLWYACLAGVLALVASALVAFDLPRRAAFALYRGEFEACIAAPGDGLRSIGPWEIELRRDAQGGSYFQTFEKVWMSDGTVHYGFAHRPDAETSPFGRVSERIPLGGDWFQFQACSR
ncbi:MAG: hypothetical protein EXS08_09100 [Planctomycetes bacterium]|nr:hypothetical protein [Planctomycetota bacterium]